MSITHFNGKKEKILEVKNSQFKFFHFEEDLSFLGKNICFNDLQSFEGIPYSFPYKKNYVKEWKLKNIYCSLACVKRDLIRQKLLHLLPLFLEMCAEVYQQTDPCPAPPVEFFLYYDMTIEEYRSFSDKKILIQISVPGFINFLNDDDFKMKEYNVRSNATKKICYNDGHEFIHQTNQKFCSTACQKRYLLDNSMFTEMAKLGIVELAPARHLLLLGLMTIDEYRNCNPKNNECESSILHFDKSLSFNNKDYLEVWTKKVKKEEDLLKAYNVENTSFLVEKSNSSSSSYEENQENNQEDNYVSF